MLPLSRQQKAQMQAQQMASAALRRQVQSYWKT
jgi:hypothetical protein